MSIVYVPQVGYIETDAVPHAFTYNADGTLASDTMTFNGATVKQTYTYVSVNGTQMLATASGWVKQ